MKKPYFFKFTAIFFSLFIALTLAFLPGCAGEKPAITQNLDELSLTDMWRVVVNSTNIQNASSYLYSMSLRALNGKIRDLRFELYGSTDSEWTMYMVSFDEKGVLNWVSSHIKDGNKMPLTMNPEVVFSRIDKFGLTNIRPTVSGFTLKIQMRNGGDYFSEKPFKLFHLKDGILTPLEQVRFSTAHPSLPIQVGSIAVDEPPKGHFETYELSEYWFLSEDLNKAEKAEYLRD